MAVLFAGFCEIAGARCAAWTLKQPWWQRAKDVQRHMLYNFGFPKEPTEAFPEATSDAIVLEGWSNIIAHVAAHFICGGLMLPVILAGDWSTATPRARELFVLGSLGDVGFDCYHGLKIVCAVYAGQPMLERLGWERVPPIMVPLTILHHSLAIAMVIPMNANYIELADYRMICFSLLFAAALCFSLNSYKMTLDVTQRGQFVAFKAILVIQVGPSVGGAEDFYHWFMRARRSRRSSTRACGSGSRPSTACWRILRMRATPPSTAAACSAPGS